MQPRWILARSARLVVFQGKQRCWAVGAPARRTRCAGGRAKKGGTMRAREGGYRIHTIHANTSRAHTRYMGHAQIGTRACIRVQCQNCILVSGRNEILARGSWHRLAPFMAPSLDGPFMCESLWPLASSFAATRPFRRPAVVG